MGRDDQEYFRQRAAEELAAAERAASSAAANAHRELSLRYSLKIVLPEPPGAGGDTRPIGQLRRVRQLHAPAAPGKRVSKRRRG